MEARLSVAGYTGDEDVEETVVVYVGNLDGAVGGGVALKRFGSNDIKCPFPLLARQMLIWRWPEAFCR